MSAVIALPRRRPPDPRQMQRCLLLAVLLHVWLVLLFGNATGTAAPGQGVWGSLTVKLLGRSGSEPGAAPGDLAPERRTNGAVGGAAEQRQGGEARPESPATPAPAEPGAAELGRWNPHEVPAEAARTDEVSTAAPSTSTLDLPRDFKPIERELLTPPVARGSTLPTPAADLPAPVGRLEARPETGVAALPSPAGLRARPRSTELPTLPADLPAAIQRLDNDAATPSRTSTLPRPAEFRAVPTTPTAGTPLAELPPPVRRLEASADTAVAPGLPRPVELRASPAATLPVPTNTALPPAVQRLEANADASAAVTPLARAGELRPTAAASATSNALPSSQDLPTAVRRLEAADSAGGVAPLQRAPNARAALATPGTSALPDLSGALPAGQVGAPAGLARGDPNADPFAAPKASAGTPDAGSRLGPDLAMPPTAAASAPRAPLNLSLPRGGEIAARRSTGLVDMLPQPPERKSKLEQSIEDAANKDCRKAYSNTGILAALPLAIDAARGKGCKW